MAHKVADRVRETSTTTGTGSYTLAGAVTGFQAMSAVMTSNNDTGFFFATDGVNWEVFLGTRSDATTLARTTIYASSNGGSAVNWGAGTKDIVGDIPARFCELLNTISIAVSSAATCDIGAVHGSVIEITGTVTITSLGTSANKLRYVRFSDALTLTHNGTSLILPGAQNIVTSAGDTAVFISDGSGNWRCWSYSPSSGIPFTPGLTFGGAAVGMTFAVQQATYVRNGRVVTFTLRLVLSAKGSSVGAALITGLPLAAAATYYHAVSMYFADLNITSDAQTALFARIEPAATTIKIWENKLAGVISSSETQLDDSYFLDNSEINLSGSYFI